MNYPRLRIDDPDGKRWMRTAADAINRLLGQNDRLSAAPANPQEGDSYYDLGLHKTRTWDGLMWRDHW